MTLSKNHIYYDLQKIDAHVHHNLNRTALLEIAQQESFSMLSINTEIPDFVDVDSQRAIVLESQAFKKGRLNFITTFSLENWGEPGWQEKALQQIKTGIDDGAVAVKIWKNIGMELTDKDGNFVMADHPSFDPIYEFLSENNIPLAAHQGEPRNCWLPLDEMTVTSDREYFSKNPKYHMYLHKNFPPYEAHLTARDNVLSKHPELTFIGLHLASLEWSVDKVAAWLDTFPNAAVDLAERVCHLQFQAADNHSKVKEFVETYQDRIIYGSDQIDDNETVEPEEIQKTIQTKWQNEFRFFSDDDPQSAWNVPHSFRGLGLSTSVLKKIFHDNAIQYYPGMA